jgi:hypothetical protein
MKRHVFFTRNQRQGETVEAYVSDLRNKVKTCRFGNLQDELVINTIQTRESALHLASCATSGTISNDVADQHRAPTSTGKGEQSMWLILPKAQAAVTSHTMWMDFS